MEMFVVILLAGVAGYFFLKHSTKRGTDTVRAYLYLSAINCVASIREANQMAQINLTTSSQHIPNAKKYVRMLYDGKQLPMIADAQRQGLILR